MSKRGKRLTRHIGSSLNEFLKKEGVLEEARTIALKETLAWQVRQAMEKKNVNKVEKARRMRTSRAALDRLLDPGNASRIMKKTGRSILKGLHEALEHHQGKSV